ncbi:Ca(2+)-dependent cysteine protease [Scheffersomyces spartinae]|uniref:Metacaspase-1 n=1 Tax=Scheffersomyces spartinae TaxID=45513 RepID=A0A9P7VC23_9ASCO|nr:Ca(2+)-dependent cysteine protease [Scheffersomyces spartinae]KAG7195214.1 Ca(2+)-dependent cysteine protease [Scheffersomyces spartinae]
MSIGYGGPPPPVPPPYGFNGTQGPPPGLQNYGGMQYGYSNCQGQKKALLIGINYFGTRYQLNGCINDARTMFTFLTREWGYSPDDIVMLTDDQPNYLSIPTRENIIRAMQWLVKDARPNDSLVFHYSGHGGQTRNWDGTESSGYDDTIMPVDFKITGEIVDDIMHDIMVRRLPPGCRLTALFDSCHSGTALDLPFVYSTRGIVKEPDPIKDSGSSLLQAGKLFLLGDINGGSNGINSAFNHLSGNGRSNRQYQIALKFSPADVISISGCKDGQTSADSSLGGVAGGAMSKAFIEVMSQYPNQLYLSLLNNMRIILFNKGYPQKPQMSCSHPLDMNLRFVI